MLLHWYVLSLCDSLFPGRYDAVQTLCRVVAFARHAIDSRLEGARLLFQAAIVRDEWWERNAVAQPNLLTLPAGDLRLSVGNAARVAQIQELSDGVSSILLISENGFIRALADIGSEERRLWSRLDEIRPNIDGVIVATDETRQLWIHAEGKAGPMMLTHGTWRRLSAHGDPLYQLAVAFSARSWPNARIAMLMEILRRLSEEHLGGFLIFDDDPAQLITVLGARPLRRQIEPWLRPPFAMETVSLAALTRLFSLDGAQCLDFDGRLHAICQHVVLPREPDEPSLGGTRRATGWRVARRRREAVVVTISSDGPVAAFIDGCMYRGGEPPEQY
jgi:hypothetical protein